MSTARAIGDVLDDLLRYAKELLDIVDEELAPLDRQRHAVICAVAPVLRQKLERLRDELRWPQRFFSLTKEP